MNEIYLLYKLLQICEDYDIIISVNSNCLYISQYGYINDKVFAFKQAYTIDEIANEYKNIENCVDAFLGEAEERKEKLKRGGSE